MASGFGQAAVAGGDRSNVTFLQPSRSNVTLLQFPAAHALPTRPGVAYPPEIVGGCAAAHFREAAVVSSVESTAAPAVPSYASGTSDVPLLGDTIGDNFDRTVAAHPDARGAGRRAHRAALDVRASCARTSTTVALGLLAAGVEKGDRVGIWAPNCAEWTLVQYATAKIGAILVNINPAYRTHELEYVLNQAGISLLVAAPSFKTSDYAAMIEEVRPSCPALREVVLLGRAGMGRARRRRASAATATSWPAGRPSCSPDDPINIQYTSGTTGFPKGATLSHHNILNNGYFVGRAAAATPRTTGSASRCPSTTASAW